jgi:cytochrome c oxidase assembly protein subunit 15
VAYRLALATLAATCVLMLLGGLVTNTGAALAVPDWPSTFGYNMVLFPWSRMVGGIFYEHSHRLMGALVGLLTLALAALLWREGDRLRRLGLIAVAVVLAQGVLGGLRVVLLENTLAIVHGSLAQAFFALLAAIALLTAPRGRVAGVRVEPALKGLTVLAAALVYAQIVFGALLTHTGRIDLHLGGAVLVFAILPIVTAPLRRTGDAVAAPVSRLLLVLLGAQLLLGVGSFLARFSPFWIPGEQLAGLALPVAHRLVGSLILAAIVILSVRVHTVNAEPERVDQAPQTHAASALRPPRDVSVPGRADRALRSQLASVSGHPRSEPASRTPLQQAHAASVSGHPRSEPADERSQVVFFSGHPRSEPASRHPLQ